MLILVNKSSYNLFTNCHQKLFGVPRNRLGLVKYTQDIGLVRHHCSVNHSVALVLSQYLDCHIIRALLYGSHQT